MKKKIYGVSLDEKITPLHVRDAIINCFIKAHKKQLSELTEFTDFESKEELKHIQEISIIGLIKKYFMEIGSDFDNPKKSDILKLIDHLKKYASHFRNQKIVEKHAYEISEPVSKLD